MTSRKDECFELFTDRGQDVRKSLDAVAYIIEDFKNNKCECLLDGLDNADAVLSNIQKVLDNAKAANRLARASYIEMCLNDWYGPERS